MVARAAASTPPGPLAELVELVAAAPTPTPGPTDTGPGAVRHRVRVPVSAARAVTAAAADAGVTPAAVVLRRVETALCRAFARESVAVGLAVADRPTPGSELVAGYLVDTVAFVARRRDGLTPRDAVRACAAELARSMDPARRVALPALVHALRRRYRGGSAPVFPGVVVGLDEETRVALVGGDLVAVDHDPGAGRAGVAVVVTTGPSGVLVDVGSDATVLDATGVASSSTPWWTSSAPDRPRELKLIKELWSCRRRVARPQLLDQLAFEGRGCGTLRPPAL